MSVTNLSSFFQRQALGAILTKVTGLIRFILQCSLLGASIANDAFIVAFMIPNLLRALFAEEGIKNSFLPILKEVEATKDEHEYRNFLNYSFSIYFIILLVITSLGIISAPLIVATFAKGFTASERILTINLARIMFPFLIFLGLFSFFMAIYQSLERNSLHTLTATAPVLNNLTSTMLFVFAFWITQENSKLYLLAISMVIGSAVQFLTLLFFAKKNKIKIQPKINFKNLYVKKFLFQFIPASLGDLAMQVNLVVDRFLASFLEPGGITALAGAARLAQFPVALAGNATADAGHSHLARGWTDNDQNKPLFEEAFFWGLRNIIFFSTPALIIMVSLALPIVRVLFQHGRFNSKDSQIMALCLIMYGLGAVIFSVIKWLKKTFSAIKDNVSYARLNWLAIGLNIPLSISGIYVFGYLGKPRILGVALGTVLAALIQILLLIRALAKPKRLGNFRWNSQKSFFKYLRSMFFSAAICFSVILLFRKIWIFKLTFSWWLAFFYLIFAAMLCLGAYLISVSIFKVQILPGKPWYIWKFKANE